MSVLAIPLHDLFAAELPGIDLRKVGEVSGLLQAMDTHAVCVVRHNTPLSDAEHIAFSLQLGPIEGGQVLVTSGEKGMRVPHHEIIDQSNLDETGAIYAADDRRLGFKYPVRM